MTSIFLHTLSREYKALRRNDKFTQLKLGRNKSRQNRGFAGGSTEKIFLSRKGHYVLFGRAKLNNTAHQAFIRSLAKEKKEKL